MKIRARLTIGREVNFCGISTPHIVAEIGEKIRVFDNRFAADQWLKDEATQIQLNNKLQSEQERK